MKTDAKNIDVDVQGNKVVLRGTVHSYAEKEEAEHAAWQAPGVLLVFARYAWPGNLRELRNVVEAMVFAAEGDVIDQDALPSDFPPLAEAAPPPDTGSVRALEALEREVIRSTLELRKGNLTRAAKDLGISRSTLYLKVKRYGLGLVLAQSRIGPRPAWRGA